MQDADAISSSCCASLTGIATRATPPDAAAAAAASSRHFRRAAAVHLTVRLLCAAVRSFFSFGSAFSLQVDAAPTPLELTMAALEDSRTPERTGGRDESRTAGCAPQDGPASAELGAGVRLSDSEVCSHAYGCSLGHPASGRAAAWSLVSMQHVPAPKSETDIPIRIWHVAYLHVHCNCIYTDVAKTASECLIELCGQLGLQIELQVLCGRQNQGFA